MSGHAHPDELTELERHQTSICGGGPPCWYCVQAQRDKERSTNANEAYRLLDEAKRQIDDALRFLQKVL